MSKQYLNTHTIDNAHITDIFALAPTSIGIVSASGSSSLQVHSTSDGEFQLIQTLGKAHKLGCHHLAVSEDGNCVASAGFGGEVKVWSTKDDKLEDDGIHLDNKAGGIWSLALSADGQYLASSSFDGRVNVWDILAKGLKIREYETKGSFGISVDISNDGRFTASSHENGGIYIFDNDTEKMKNSLPSLATPVRCVAFSPGCKLLAAASDAKVIALYDVGSGEQVANFIGHDAWVMSLDWSSTGEYLLSGAFNGKSKVWSIDQMTCVATHAKTGKTVWSVKWLRKSFGKSELFATAGADRSISFYREASGG